MKDQKITETPLVNIRSQEGERDERIILGIDPGLAHTGWGLVRQCRSRLICLAYGCIETTKNEELPFRLQKIYQQMVAVVQKYQPQFVGVETVWFGENAQSAFATGQARGAALAACAQAGMQYREYSPKQIKLAVVGTGSADKKQVQYMVQHLLGLEVPPEPDHAADALAAALCLSTHRFEQALGHEQRQKVRWTQTDIPNTLRTTPSIRQRSRKEFQ